jgi:hypothetical protein
MIEAYPLCWPQGKPRTPLYQVVRSNFKTSFAIARDKVLREINLLGGRDPIISTNLPLRRDGLPLAQTKAIQDTGVAVYFTYKKKSMSFCCDRWQKIEDNMHAITLTIGALRGISRWGTGDMMEAAFTGFAALPAPGQQTRSWRDVLGADVTSCGELEARYRSLRSSNHPDKGGSSETFHAVQIAYEQAKQELRS